MDPSNSVIKRLWNISLFFFPSFHFKMKLRKKKTIMMIMMTMLMIRTLKKLMMKKKKGQLVDSRP